jgi:SAM-dependent methyltransferase
LAATEQLDTTAAEAFGGRMTEILNGGFLGLLISVGYQLELFERLAELPPAGSVEIAAAAGLDERYVREWLAALTVGGVLLHRPETGTFELPPEHAAFLTRAAGPNDIAFLTRYIGLSGMLEPEILECFRTGAGLPYERYPGFQELQAADSARSLDATLLDGVLPLVPGLPERLARGLDVLDVGCGAGHALNLMAGRFERSRFTGYDFSEEGLAAGRAEAAALGNANVRFAACDVHELDEPEAYDLVTAFDVVHDLAHPARALAAIRRSLRPDGVFLMVEIAASSSVEGNVGHPLGPMLYAASIFHCMSVSIAQGGEGHGTCWGRENEGEALAAAGFANVEAKQLDDDPFHTIFVSRR